MMSVADAIRFAGEHFPEGPERLAEQMEVDVHYSPMSGCDGWCLSGKAASIIRVNSAAASTRQRFTLAHELGHLLLGTAAVIGESISDILRTDSEEERKVNQIAAELLMPTASRHAIVGDPPISAIGVRKLAKAARVSELAAALRVVGLAEDLGLIARACSFLRTAS